MQIQFQLWLPSSRYARLLWIKKTPLRSGKELNYKYRLTSLLDLKLTSHWSSAKLWNYRCDAVDLSINKLPQMLQNNLNDQERSGTPWNYLYTTWQATTEVKGVWFAPNFSSMAGSMNNFKAAHLFRISMGLKHFLERHLAHLHRTSTTAKAGLHMMAQAHISDLPRQLLTWCQTGLDVKIPWRAWRRCSRTSPACTACKLGQARQSPDVRPSLVGLYQDCTIGRRRFQFTI